MTDQKERSVSVAIIAAMERELGPLTSDWELSTLPRRGPDTDLP